MGLQNILKQYTEHEESRSGENPFSNLKNPIIYPKRVGSITVRILPPKGLDDSNNFVTLYRSAYLRAPSSYKRPFVNLTTSYKRDNNDPLVQAASKWEKDEKIPLPPKYKRSHAFSTSYYIQVVPVNKDNSGHFVNKLDNNGLLDVSVMSIPYYVYNALMSALSNKENDPKSNDFYQQALDNFHVSLDNNDDWSFISPSIAYSVTINYNKDASSPSDYYSFNVNSNKMLPPLPNNWDSQLEDVDSLVVPSYISNPDFVNSYLEDINSEIYGEENTGEQAPNRTEINPSNMVPNNESHQFDNANVQQAQSQGQLTNVDSNVQEQDGGFKSQDELFDTNDSSLDIDDDDLPF